MNIMLVSVTERIREIGLKKAIGAKKSHIMAQFLTEAAVLTSLGGAVGVAAGLILAQVISRVSGHAGGGQHSGGSHRRSFFHGYWHPVRAAAVL